MRFRTLRTVAVAGVMSVLGSLALAAAGPAAQAAPTGPTSSPGSGTGRPHNELLRKVLGEHEDEDFDPPNLSALCQSFIGQPNPYRNPAPNVNQIHGDTIVPLGSQAGCSTAQNETAIAVNPANPRNIVAGSNDYRLFNSREQRNDSTGVAYTSFDGGRTWTNVLLPHLNFQTGATGALSFMDAAGDPVLAFGPANTVYYGNIVFSRAAPADGGTEGASGIVLNVSHDGGLHWGEPVIIQLDGVDAAGTPTPTRIFNDKVWLAADRHSGRVYVTWTMFADNPDGSFLEAPIVVASSRDFGRTFTPFNRIDTTLADFRPGGITPFSQGSNPQVGRDGTLYVAYEGTQCATLDCDQPTDRDVIVVATSRDHGATFRKSIVDTDFDFPPNEDVGRSTLTGENFRISSFPMLSYDPVFDQLYVTWADDRNGQYTADGESIRTNGDNLVATSRGGARWSRSVVVGTAQDEVFGAVAAFAGFVAVSSYTRHYDPAGIKLDYAYWKSLGAPGLGRAGIHRITTESSNPQVQFVGVGEESGEELQGVFIGDYTGLAIGTDLRIHPSWTDFRGRPGETSPNQDAYTQSISLL
ncbi:MAG TPA: sialidase family protein [Mycobacteriales bacterium]|nr:sialidase family protein [Mycobacteriales bacterium]